jgi:hypothetical protein
MSRIKPTQVAAEAPDMGDEISEASSEGSVQQNFYGTEVAVGGKVDISLGMTEMHVTQVGTAGDRGARGVALYARDALVRHVPVRACVRSCTWAPAW